jgi:hypothetical protein
LNRPFFWREPVATKKSVPVTVVDIAADRLVVTLGRARITRTVGLPGTGIFYTSRQGTHTGYHSAKHDAPVTPAAQTAADRSAERVIGVVVLIVIFLLMFLLLHG